ncbi:hypothetical protein DL98DRAFT_592625 [Cadophora sp. DSE1049]|nr:hypothetical protein DL98DRAFT_592625 [Cadophora sp. DSE1049]
MSLDVRPENDLIGSLDSDEHRRFPVLKLAYFGLSCSQPADIDPVRNPDWVAESQWRATLGFQPPEQMYGSHTNRRIGVQTSVWAVGAVMYCLVVGRLNNWMYTFLHADPNGYFRTVVGDPAILRDSTQHFPYSARVIDVLCHCFMEDPDERATSRILVNDCQAMVDIFDTMTKDLPPTQMRSLKRGQMSSRMDSLYEISRFRTQVC